MSMLKGDCSKGLSFEGCKSRTKQAFKKECEIQYVLDRCMKGDFSSLGEPNKAQYGDFTGVDDYQSALNLVNDAQLRFAALPAKLRDRFDNNPVNLLAFVNDASNYDEAVKLGLVLPKPVATEQQATPATTVAGSTTVTPPVQ